MRARFRFGLLLLTIILRPMTAQAQDIDFFEDLNFITCPYNTPASHETECGFLAVPENRADPDSRKIQIAFAVVRTNHPDPEPDPLVYLVGGPGGSMLARLAWVWNSQFAPLAERRDVIFVDQRGTGFAQPRLYCDEIVENYARWVGGSRDSEAHKAFTLEILQTCHDRLAADGADLTAYNSAESAADFETLRRALGYEEWNLYGVSYGTRLALTIMRDHPDGIRSVILDSVLPLQANLYTELPDHIARVLDVLFEGCASDNPCSTTYPYFHDVFWKLVSDLNTEPLELTVSRPDVGQINLIIDGNRVVNWVFNWSYAVSDIERIPAYVHALASGDREQMTS
jgi:pimeloyl-ACP methyl ester carboxylesterase